MSFSKLIPAAAMALFSASACEAVDAFQGGRLPENVKPATAGGGLYDRLGGNVGIEKVVKDFVGRAASDSRINGYFLNNNVIPERLVGCLVIQVAALTGGPYTYPSMGCRGMKEVHTGMGVSTKDFNDTAEHLVTALTSAGVARADIDTIVSAVTPTAADIVEDPGNNKTVYQRVGRKPAIEAVVVGFLQEAFKDPSISGFFAGGNADRLRTCLVRQVCGIDGPCKYGKEVNGEAGVAANAPCKDMLTTHRGINSPRAITKADFDVVVQLLVRVLDGAGVPAVEKMNLLNALGPTCKDIVANGTGC